MIAAQKGSGTNRAQSWREGEQRQPAEVAA
jgi:hypothetical protein